MSRPRWPDVYAGLLAVCESLPGGFEVFDGQPLANATAMDYVTVGFHTDDGAGSFNQAADPSGFATVETGQVYVQVASNAGDTDPTVTRGAAFGFFAALQDALRLDDTLAGRIPAGSVLSLSAQVMDVENEQGSATQLLLAVNYQTVTYINA